MTESKTDPGVPGPPIPAPVDASALEQLIAKWRGREIAAGQYSVDTGSQYAAGQAHALRDLADELEALLAAPRAPLEGEQSCQAATGDTAGDIGVIEPSVFDAESVAVPTDSPRAPLEPREEKSWLIFDERSECFWGPNRGGYWKGLTHAGLYTEQEAREAENFAKRYGRNEVAVPLERYRAEIERLADALATRPRPALGPQE
jgi:hypothetical protein